VYAPDVPPGGVPREAFRSGAPIHAAREEGEVDPELIETFLEIVRLGGMRRAATALHLSQPAVSARIRELEKRLDARLFERLGRRLELTESGRLVAREGPGLVAAHGALWRRVREQAGIERRTLRLATIDAASIYVLPEVYLEFRESHPTVRLTVQVVDSRHVLAAVATREADLGVVTLPASHPEVDVVPVFEEELVCVGDGTHSPATRGQLTLAALAAEPLVLYPKGSTTRGLLDAVFAAHGVTPNVVMETASPEAMQRLAEVGVGSSILPEPLVRGAIAAGRLRHVRLRDVRFVRRLATAVRRGRELPEAARWFQEIVHRHYPPLADRPAARGSRKQRGVHRNR